MTQFTIQYGDYTYEVIKRLDSNPEIRRYKGEAWVFGTEVHFNDLPAYVQNKILTGFAQGNNE